MKRKNVFFLFTLIFMLPTICVNGEDCMDRKIENQYRSIFYFGDFVISSIQGVWSDDDFSKQKMIFPGSKAELKKGDKRVVLFADTIIYDKAKSRLIGENAKIFDHNGRKLFEGSKIIVSTKNPEEIKVIQ